MEKYRIKIVLQLMIFVFFTFQSHGQPQINDSSEAYDYWGRRGIIEVIYAYMNDYIATVSDSTINANNRKDCTFEKVGLDNYREQFIVSIEQNQIDEIISKFNQVSEFLNNNNWRGAEKNVFQPLLEKLNNRIILNEEFFSTLKKSSNESSTNIPGYNNKMIHWNNTISKIITNYEEDKNELMARESKKSSAGQVNEQPSNGSQNPNSNNIHKFNWFLIISISILSLISGSIMSYSIIRSRIYRAMGNDIDKYRYKIKGNALFSITPLVKVLKDSKDKYKQNSIRMETELTILEEKYNTLLSLLNNQAKIDTNIDSPVERPDETNNTVEWVVINNPQEQKGIYFTIPDSDGKFDVADGKNQNDGNCFYLINIKPNGTQGLISYLPNEKDKRAIENIENYLLPVCEIENFSDRKNASRIMLKDAGIVNLKHDSWVIDNNQKIKIKLV